MGENPMRGIEIDKVVINCSVGEAGDKILKACKVLKDLTNQDPVTSKCKYTIRSFGVRRGDKIGTHVTVRGDKAKEMLLFPRTLRIRYSRRYCFGNHIRSIYRYFR